MKKVSKLGLGLMASAVLLATPVTSFAATNPHQKASKNSVKEYQNHQGSEKQFKNGFYQAQKDIQQKLAKLKEAQKKLQKQQQELMDKKQDDANLAKQMVSIQKQMKTIQDKVATYSKKLDDYAVVVKVLPFPSTLQSEQQQLEKDLANAKRALKPYEYQFGESFGRYDNPKNVQGYLNKAKDLQTKFATVDKQVNDALGEVDSLLEGLQFPSSPTTSTTGTTPTPTSSSQTTTGDTTTTAPSDNSGATNGGASTTPTTGDNGSAHAPTTDNSSTTSGGNAPTDATSGTGTSTTSGN